MPLTFLHYFLGHSHQGISRLPKEIPQLAWNYRIYLTNTGSNRNTPGFGDVCLGWFDFESRKMDMIRYTWNWFTKISRSDCLTSYCRKFHSCSFDWRRWKSQTANAPEIIYYRSGKYFLCMCSLSRICKNDISKTRADWKK